VGEVVTRLPVRLRAQAHQDIKDIFDWIVAQSSYQPVAQKFVNRIYDRCENLSDFPMSGIARDDLHQGLRILAFERRAVIAYRVLVDAVEVTNIFYGGRDWEAIVAGSQDENPDQ
jgi:toxin ParE1/3/4